MSLPKGFPQGMCRIAIREQGDLIAAYWAHATTMDNAFLISTISRALCEMHPEAFDQWKQLNIDTMAMVFADHGLTPGDWKEGHAPAHEKAGDA